MLQSLLDDEEAVIKALNQTYQQALTDVEEKAKKLQKQIEELDEIEKLVTDPDELEVIFSRKRSKVYQKKYQNALNGQLTDILDNMHEKNYKTISSYINGCYNEGFLGAMYSLHKQDIPLIFPINQKAVTEAVLLNSKISEGLYNRLGEDVAGLKRTIANEVSRGISTGASYHEIAKQIQSKMVGVYDKKSGGSLYRAETIAITEGHRVQIEAQFKAMLEAKEKGADILKQWDATKDNKVRPSHMKVDTEIRELDEKFSNGLMFPGDKNGKAGEVIRCRCALLQRARAGLDEQELEYIKEKAAFYGLDKTENFEDFKEKYLDVVDIEKALENIVKNSTIKIGSNLIIAMAKKLPNAKERSRVINEAISAKQPVYSDDLREAYKRVKPKDGCMDICLHGTPYYMEYEYQYIIDTETLAYIISGRKDFCGDDIRLLSCSTGKADKYGNCVAQELANRLGVRVYAPIKVLNIHPDGKLSVGREQLSEDEGFKWFEPKKGGKK